VRVDVLTDFPFQDGARDLERLIEVDGIGDARSAAGFVIRHHVAHRCHLAAGDGKRTKYERHRTGQKNPALLDYHLQLSTLTRPRPRALHRSAQHACGASIPAPPQKCGAVQVSDAKLHH
jgi:hypothetical protein